VPCICPVTAIARGGGPDAVTERTAEQVARHQSAVSVSA
jgi:hypothetical protein